jgi:hypothetical protein
MVPLEVGSLKQSGCLLFIHIKIEIVSVQILSVIYMCIDCKYMHCSSSMSRPNSTKRPAMCGVFMANSLLAASSLVSCSLTCTMVMPGVLC